MDNPINMTAYSGVFGADNNYSAIPANMMNASATSDIDWGAVVTNGIKGAAFNAINTMVGGAYASGQLQNPATVGQPIGSSSQTMQLLVLGAVAWLVFGKAA
jgi:hypothetical protein